MEFKFRALLEKYLADSISESEKAQLFQMLQSTDYESELEQIIDNGFLEGKISGLADQRRAKALFDKIVEAGQVSRKPFFSRRLRYTAAAAAILLMLSVAIYKFSTTNSTSPAIAGKGKTDEEIVPGSDKAMLTLADGTVIILDSTGTKAMRQGNTAIRQYRGQLQYLQQEPETGISYNTLTTPLGGQFRLTLPDGSKIWLNAASSITYPTAFTGNRRKVSITGEVYMEIAKNENMPFEVIVKDVEITVLGTCFNINAYEDEPSMNTTLLEGAVKVSRTNNDQLLMPGQQEQLLPDGTFKIIDDIDTASVVAWKNGMFSFNDADIPAVMRQINRWYDAEIVYKSEVSQHFMGSVPRNVPVSKLLTMLELTGRLHFKIDGRKIIVTQ
ncbi:FecR family protein [Chitinophaga sp. CF118]|uniref:FecR family protein n=1 Tax=Chitinophaga sp. CF118 TaxID=1884367 RepID=UPI0008E72708|nr:FecR family protein [Chitinophaga sp. CF118]SFD78084.1 FecR family protein [Chitinophaga sp. CF118]